MKTRVLTVTMSLIAVLGLTAGAVHAGEVTADVNADVSFLTDYLWRGQTYGEDGVIQPNLSIGFANGLSLGVWANYIVDWEVLDSGLSNSHLVNEVDYTVDYSFEAGPVGCSLGWILYDFPRSGGAETQEVYVGLTLDTLLAPSITAYRDVRMIDGTYLSFGVGHDFELNEKTTLSVGGTLGWGNEAYHKAYFPVSTPTIDVEEDSLSDYNLSVSLSYAITDKVTVTPTLSYSAFSDSDVEDAADIVYGEDSKVYGGINVSYSF